MAAHQRPIDTLISDGKTGHGYGRLRHAPMLNLVHSGSNGISLDYPNYISNTQYLRRNLILRLVSSPRGFDLLDEPERWHEALKSLIETIPQSVTGFNNQLEVDVQGTTFGGAGEIQEAYSNVTRSRVEPVFNYVEKYGRPIATFFERWVTELGMDPNTKYPNVITREASRGRIIDLLPDFTSATILAFEADPTFTKIDKAWLVADFKPKGSLAPAEGVRDIHNAHEQVEFPINFTGVAQVGAGVDRFAQQVLDSMDLRGVNMMRRESFTNDISGTVRDLGYGIKEQLERAAREQVRM